MYGLFIDYISPGLCQFCMGCFVLYSGGKKLHHVQNNAAQFILLMRKYDRITQL